MSSKKLYPKTYREFYYATTPWAEMDVCIKLDVAVAFLSEGENVKESISGIQNIGALLANIFNKKANGIGDLKAKVAAEIILNNDEFFTTLCAEAQEDRKFDIKEERAEIRRENRRAYTLGLFSDRGPCRFDMAYDIQT